MGSTRAWALVFGGALALAILLAIVGGMLERAGVKPSPALALPAAIVFGALFLAMGFSAIPLMVRIVLAGQRAIGNEALAPVRFLADHQTGVVLGVWALFALGLLIAIPAAISDGALGRAAEVWLQTRLRGASKGRLVANVGLSFDEIRERSSVPLATPSREPLTGSTRAVAEIVFDLELAGTGVRFEGCRYYFLTTGSHGDAIVRSMNVGVSPHSLIRPEADAERAEVQRRFRADGWAPGRFVYRSEKEQALHGGQTSAGEGMYWLKGDALVHLEPKRVDDEQRGEDPRTAGRWMLALSISDRSASSTYPRLDFSSTTTSTTTK